MTMRFFFADSQDYIDPGYNFESDQYTPGRIPQRDDLYAHEYYDTPPYDGMLVSRAIVGDERWQGKYSTAQSIRFRREGARAFLRYHPEQNGGVLMGDCGAFSYLREPNPPYTVPEMVEYYADSGFTHAVSIDHVILGYNEKLDAPSLFPEAVPLEWQRRWDLTLRLAEEFLEYCANHNAPFHPIGVAQGWSPNSYTLAVKRLVEIGYDYVALGGMVPLKVDQIHRVLKAVRDVAPTVKLHLFGFTKADNIPEFLPYNIASFDSTSPLLRAFKDNKRNYLAQKRWYIAVRVPHADESRHFKLDILAGIKSQQLLRDQEERALLALRAYSHHKLDLADALVPVLSYGKELHGTDHLQSYSETLADRPWEHCSCRACIETGIDVMIFRGSNRNRRRGFHNLWEFHRQLCIHRKPREQELAQHAV